jgi:hypothetical protein
MCKVAEWWQLVDLEWEQIEGLAGQGWLGCDHWPAHSATAIFALTGGLV